MTRTSKYAREVAWREEHPDRWKARAAVERAVKRGDIERRPCAVCGATKVEAHHEDYERRLDITWLCSTHHKRRHIELNGGSYRLRPTGK